MRQHYLKCHPQFMPRIASGQKPFEIRKNDRDYQVGDRLTLREYTPGEVQLNHNCSNPDITVEIIYISFAFQQDGYAVLGIKLVNDSTDGAAK